MTAIQDANTDIELVYEALEQLREIIVFENNGTTSKLVDFFRFCKGMTASTDPTVTLSVNSSEPTEVASISSTIVMAPKSTMETSTFTKSQLNHSPAAIIPSPPENYSSTKASSSIELNSYLNVDDTVVTSSVDLSQEEEKNKFPWLSVRNLDECDLAYLQFKNCIDDVILAPYGHIKHYQEFFHFADAYSRSHYAKTFHTQCFTFEERGKSSLNYFWSVIDLIDNFVNMTDLTSLREIFQFPNIVANFDDKLRQYCGWMADEFKGASEQKFQNLRRNIGIVRTKIRMAKNKINDWERILAKWRSFPIENIEQYLTKDINKQELAKQFLSQQSVTKRENFF